MTLALVTALTWGVLEVLLLRSAKDIGALRLGFWLMVLGCVLIVPVALAAEPIPDVRQLPVAVIPALVGLAGSALYLVALRDGKLALVSPTVSTSGGIGAVIAILVLGERLGPFTVAALCAAVVGVVLAALRPRSEGSGGMTWAVIAAVLFGAYTVALSVSAQAVGPIWAVAAYRITGIVVLGGILAAARISPKVGRAAMRVLVWAVMLETVGFIAFTVALTLGPVAIVSVIMGQFSTVAILFATLLLRERLLGLQWVGVVLMLSATAFLAAVQ